MVNLAGRLPATIAFYFRGGPAAGGYGIVPAYGLTLAESLCVNFGDARDYRHGVHRGQDAYTLDHA